MSSMSDYIRWIHTRNCIKDPVTGFIRSKGDTGRSGLHGGHPHVSQLPKCTYITLKSRCPPECLLCGGDEPGCQGGSVRREIKLRRYEASVNYTEQKLRRDNAGYMRDIGFFRTLAFLYYLRTFTFSFRNPSQVFFSLYDQSLTR
jgi:hypothetical protein